jgi:hypothetical protein
MDIDFYIHYLIHIFIVTVPLLFDVSFHVAADPTFGCLPAPQD